MAQWFETADRKVAYCERNGVCVSTIFLGIDHRYSPNEPRQIFETMIFGGEHNDFQERYATRAEALAGHERAVAMVKRTPRKLTEAEAWRWLAMMFENGGSNGICNLLDHLFKQCQLTDEVYCQMSSRIRKLVVRQGRAVYLYPSPSDLRGSGYRQKLCLRWARLAERRASDTRMGGTQ